MVPTEDAMKACATPQTGSTFNMAVCEHLAGFRDNAAGNVARAEFHYRNALRLWEQVTPPRNDLRAATLISLSDLLAAQARIEEAGQLVSLARKTATPAMMPSVLAHYGTLLARTEDPERARPLLDEAIRLFGQAVNPEPAEVAYALNALGTLDLSGGKYAAAEASFRRALELNISPESVNYQTNLGLALYMQGRYRAAEVMLERARESADAGLKPVVLSHLAVLESALNRFGTAEDYALQSLDGFRRIHPEASPEIVTLKVTLGSIYLREHKLKEAEKTLPDAVALERNMPIDSRLKADGLLRLADLRALQKQTKEAGSLYREALALYEQRLGPNHPDVARLRKSANIVRAMKSAHPA